MSTLITAEKRHFLKALVKLWFEVSIVPVVYIVIIVLFALSVIIIENETFLGIDI